MAEKFNKLQVQEIYTKKIFSEMFIVFSVQILLIFC